MLKLAVPANPVFKDLYSFPEELLKAYDIQILKVRENDCFDLLVTDRVGAALLSPLTYGKGMPKSDFRILNAPVIFSENRTSLASIVFAKGLKTIHKIYSSTPDDFFMQLGKILLAEKYNIITNLVETKLSVSEHLEKNETVIAWNGEIEHEASFDISEEWYDHYEIPLPLAFWVCHAEDYPEKIELILNKIYPFQSEKLINKSGLGSDHSELYEGKIIFSPDSDFEEALEHTLHLLYYHRYFNDLPAIKIMGRD